MQLKSQEITIFGPLGECVARLCRRFSASTVWGIIKLREGPMGPQGRSHGDSLGCPGIPCGCNSGVPPPTALQACAICENKMAVAAVLWSPHPPRCSHTQSAKKKLLWLQSRGPPPTPLQPHAICEKKLLWLQSRGPPPHRAAATATFLFAKRAGLQPQRGKKKRGGGRPPLTLP